MKACVTFTPPPTLRRFMRSDAFVRAVVGPVGSGKSSACVMELVRRAAEQPPGPDNVRRSRFAVIRNTYGELRDTTRKTFEQWVPASTGEWHEQSFTFRVDRALVDGTRLHFEVLFRALDRPEDVKKLLSLELTGAYVNEAREVPKHVLDVLQTRIGRYPSKMQGGAPWFGIWMDTNPWPTSHWGYELFSRRRPEGFALFEQPGGRSARAENVENLPNGYYERLCHGKDSEWVSEYVDGEYPSNDKGSIYGEWLSALERRGSLGVDFEHPSDGVFVSLDLGISDATALWFWRLGARGVPDFIDWYEATGQSAAHFFERIESSGYRVERIWLPHDARARTFQTGVSTLEQFIQRFGASRVGIGPELSVDDGIGAARWLLEQPVRFHARCEAGVQRLRSYRYAWDEAKKVYSKKPVHDWTSHTADAFRYVACVAHATERRARPPAAPAPRPAGRSLDSFTLDELFAAAPRPGKERL